MGKRISLSATERYCLALSVFLVAAVLPGLTGAAWIDLGGDGVTVSLLESDGARSVVEITLGGFDAEPVDIDGQTYYLISLAREGLEKEAGYPELPSVRRSLIIPDDREMAVSVLSSEHVEFTDLPVAPSKGHLLRTVDPATVPYRFDAFYQSAGTYPAAAVQADAPHILRDYRGMVVDANIFQYSPGTQTLRVYTRMVIEVRPVGPGSINVLERTGPITKMDRQFANLYRDHFLNFTPDSRYVPVLEDGGLLIITYDAFLSSVQPLVEWKLQKGIATKLVTLSDTGPSYSQIRSYILAEYQDWGLSYVLLVGDGAQIPKYGSDSDPGYSLLVGSDSYPEIFVGRFSAETPEHVVTQVQRTISYERDVAAGYDWPQRGTGVASNQGPGHYGEYDNQHMDLIRDDLLAYGYLGVDQIYDPTGTSTMVSNALNAGRGIVNYCGHGSQTSWGSTGFSNTHVNALINDDMLPFICSVACNNGTFTPGTCFAEAWMRATHNGQPTGAIACYMSYISQSWDPPMYAEDEAVDLLVADEMRTVGGLWFNGSCHMMDMTGASGENEFRNWTIFGDPSLAVRTKVAESLVVSHPGVLLIGMNEYSVDVTGTEGALCALYADGLLYGSALTDAAGHAVIAMADPPLEPMTLTLTITAYNKVTHVEGFPVLPPEGPYLIFDTALVLDAAGDDDGVLDEGETAGLEITLENVGVEAAINISGTIATDDPYVVVTTGELTFPDIPAGGFGTCDGVCTIRVAGDVPDQHLVPFTLQTTADNGVWDTNFFLTVQAPVLTAGEIAVDDGLYGNGNGGADAGETVFLTIPLSNVGHSDASDLSGRLVSVDPDVIILGATVQCDDVPVGGEVPLGSFQVQILPSCPEPSYLDFQLEITARNGFVAQLLISLSVGGWFDDMEQDRGWLVGGPADNALSGIWARVDPVGTTYEGHLIQPEDDHTDDPGSLCFVTGNGTPGGTAGENDVDDGQTTLYTPIFDLAGAISAHVSYYRWYTNSWGNNPDQDWWDVAVTDDGQTWVSLEHTQQTDAAWVQYSFELADYVTLTDHVQIRFVAADVSPGSLVEAGVDDFLLTIVRPLTTGVEDDRSVTPLQLSLGENYPNPFNPRTTIHFDLPREAEVELSVYDMTGRKVVTLVSGRLEAGHHELSWLGRDRNGRQVASGLYVSRLESGGEVLTRKMLLLK